MNYLNKTFLGTFALTSFLMALPTPSEKYAALHDHFTQKTTEPIFLLIIIGIVILLIIVSLIQKQVHMKHIKKQHEETVTHQKELINHHKEFLDHVRRKQ